MRPRRLTPAFLEKVWGSAKLAPWFPNRDSGKIGEVWFHTPEIPLLVKFLFTTEKLSVQVHPDDDYARLHHGSCGKTEMWHILAAEPGAQIAAGFRTPLTEEQLRKSSLSGEIETLLEWHDARPGDTFFIPAGTVHAIGKGLALCEIQQHSDVTYRLYDYGRPRELHLDHGIAVSHRERCQARPAPSGHVLVSCEYFVTSRRTGPHICPSNSLAIVIEGEGRLDGERTVPGDVWHLTEAAGIEGNVTTIETKTASQ